MRSLKWINVGLRGIMELGIVLGLGYWGYHATASDSLNMVLAVAVPLVIFGFWGLVNFQQFGNKAEPLRLIQELVISGLAAFALYVAGAHLLGWTLALLSVIHHSLVYMLGDRLLKERA